MSPEFTQVSRTPTANAKDAYMLSGRYLWEVTDYNVEKVPFTKVVERASSIMANTAASSDKKSDASRCILRENGPNGS